MSAERIDLYFGLIDAVDMLPAYQTCLSSLSSAEKQRAARFVFEHHRRQYIFAHGLLRIALSNFMPNVEPSVWCFTADRYGRSFISAPIIPRRVYSAFRARKGALPAPSLVTRRLALTWRRFASGIRSSKLLAAVSLRRKSRRCETY